MSGVMTNGSIGSRIGQPIHSRNVFEWNSPKREFDRKSARTDRDRVKKLTFGNCRIWLKTMMDGSKCRDRQSRSNFLIDWGSKYIQKVVSKNRLIKMRSKSESVEIRVESIEAKNGRDSAFLEV
jgi:hypothetical protein